MYELLYKVKQVNRLRMLREQHGMTQAALADLLGVKNVTISKYETERLSLNVGAIIRLCELFQVTSDYLMCIDNTDNTYNTDNTFVKHHNGEILEQLNLLPAALKDINKNVYSLISLISAHQSADIALLKDEKKLLSLYRMLDKDQKNTIINAIYDLLNSNIL